MMLLIVAASLVGISSSSIYQPANVKSQPQKQLVPNPGQIVNQPPPVLVPTQQPQPQQQSKQRIEGLLTREQGGAGQYMADTELVDRIMPLIIQKMDGKTLMNLLQKVDGKVLAQKVLPYLDIKNSVTPSGNGLTYTAGEDQGPFRLKSWCPQGSKVTGGGFVGPGDMINSYLDGEGDVVVLIKGNPKVTGYYAVQAYCLSSELVAK